MELNGITDWLRKRIEEQEFHEFLAKTLLELCAVETIPSRDLVYMKNQEDACYRIIERSIERYGLKGDFQKSPFSPAIRSSPAYTFPYYAGSEEAYKERYNLLYRWKSPARMKRGKSLGINAHIDTVAPFFSPFRNEAYIFGRGACDDKGGCTVIVAAIRLLQEIHTLFGILPQNDLTFMFVTDEETGGNGSLSLSLDRELKKTYDAMIVLESCDNQIHPANRGALWYKLVIPTEISEPVILALEVIRELEREGSAIKSESGHPLFSKNAVHTNHGILGPFGEFPSRICGHVEFALIVPCAKKVLIDLLEKGLKEYTKIYGDKSTELNTETGFPKVAQHFALEPSQTAEPHEYILKVWGRAGHMGSIEENDNALTKAAFLISAVREKYVDAKISFPEGAPLPLTLEGGQGFVPTHTIDQIKGRLVAAVFRAYRNSVYYREGIEPKISFDKLHNDAFDGNKNGPLLRTALSCAEILGVSVVRPVEGWNVSCDARLFAREYPGIEVLTLGPGKLQYAHSDNENICLSDISRSCGLLALLFLLQGQS